MKKKVLCTICVRKGSKGLKNKNIKKINNTPLFLITLKQALKSKIFDKIVVNSDSKIIKKICGNYNVYFIDRKKNLTQDYISKIKVIRDSLIETEKKFDYLFDTIIDLDATSPLREISDIIKSYRYFNKSNYNNLVTGSEAKKNPYFNQIKINKKSINIVCKNKKNIVSRQQAPKIYDLNASIYVWKRNSLLNAKKLIDKKTGFFKMKIEKSLDIDSSLDFKIVKYILESKASK